MPLLRSTEIPLRATLLIDAPEGAVRRVLRRTDVWTRTVRALGARADVATVGAPAGPRGRLEDGDLIRVRRDGGSVLWPPRSLILRVDLQAEEADQLPTLDLLAGPLGRCHVGLTSVATGAGTLVTVDVRVRAVPAVLTATLRRRVLAAAQVFLGIALLAAREIQVVVAGAVIENGKVLAARRTAPSELAGFWELPGGKVDPGESEQDALRRELAEELGIAVTVGERIGAGRRSRRQPAVALLSRADAGGSPMRPNEHDAAPWVDADGLDAVDWLAADRQILPDAASRTACRRSPDLA